jgi:hypothetical protein
VIPDSTVGFNVRLHPQTVQGFQVVLLDSRQLLQMTVDQSEDDLELVKLLEVTHLV